MCDTVVLFGNSGSTAFFGKNSDRHPDEPQALVLVPAREPGTVSLKQEVQVPDKGFAFLLSKPSWMKGGEMGINSHGLAIGNEAVFSRFKPAPDGVLGMDMLRAALGTCMTAREAVDFLTSLVETCPQGGNGAFKGSMVYNNSFLCADPHEAYIVETAGNRWAWRPAMAADAISNAYCIEDDYKRLDIQTRKEIAPVNERAACSDEADPGRKGSRNSWKEHVEDRKYLFFTKGEMRRSQSLSGLMRLAATGTAMDAESRRTGMMKLLGSHEGAAEPGPILGHMKNLCVHPGLFPKSATTASMMVEYLPEGALIWYTGTSYPCISIYKPVLLYGGTFHSLWKPIPGEADGASVYAYWGRWRQWAHAGGLKNARSPDFTASREEVQRSIGRIAAKAHESAAEGKSAPGRLSPMYAGEIAALVSEWEARWIR